MLTPEEKAEIALKLANMSPEQVNSLVKDMVGAVNSVSKVLVENADKIWKNRDAIAKQLKDYPILSVEEIAEKQKQLDEQAEILYKRHKEKVKHEEEKQSNYNNLQQLNAILADTNTNCDSTSNSCGE